MRPHLHVQGGREAQVNGVARQRGRAQSVCALAAAGDLALPIGARVSARYAAGGEAVGGAPTFWSSWIRTGLAFGGPAPRPNAPRRGVLSATKSPHELALQQPRTCAQSRGDKFSRGAPPVCSCEHRCSDTGGVWAMPCRRFPDRRVRMPVASGRERAFELRSSALGKTCASLPGPQGPWDAPARAPPHRARARHSRWSLSAPIHTPTEPRIARERSGPFRAASAYRRARARCRRATPRRSTSLRQCRQAFASADSDCDHESVST